MALGIDRASELRFFKPNFSQGRKDASIRVGRQRTVFIVERAARGKRQSYRYLYGSCGTPLIHHAMRELLDSVFSCRT